MFELDESATGDDDGRANLFSSRGGTMPLPQEVDGVKEGPRRMMMLEMVSYLKQ
jgi:hypothetical protein